MVRMISILAAFLLVLPACGRTDSSTKKRYKMGDRARKVEEARKAKERAEREKKRKEEQCKRNPKSCGTSASADELFAKMYEQVEASCDVYVLDKEAWEQGDVPQRTVKIRAFPVNKQTKKFPLNSPSNLFKAQIDIKPPILTVMDGNTAVAGNGGDEEQAEDVAVTGTVPGVNMGVKLGLTEISSDDGVSDDYDTSIPVGVDQAVIVGKHSMKSETSGKTASVTVICKLTATPKKDVKQ